MSVLAFLSTIQSAELFAEQGGLITFTIGKAARNCAPPRDGIRDDDDRQVRLHVISINRGKYPNPFV
jgi:hypothetical protein